MLTATLHLCMLDNTQSDTTGFIRPILIIFSKFDTLKNDPIFVELDSNLSFKSLQLNLYLHQETKFAQI